MQTRLERKTDVKETRETDRQTDVNGTREKETDVNKIRDIDKHM